MYQWITGAFLEWFYPLRDRAYDRYKRKDIWKGQFNSSIV